MSVMEPPEPGEENPEEEIDKEVENVEIPDVPPEPPITGSPLKDVCKHCMRPVCNESDNLEKYPSGWSHWNPKIDQPTNAAHHVAELYEEAPVKWGFLNTKGLHLDVKDRGRNGGATA